MLTNTRSSSLCKKKGEKREVKPSHIHLTASDLTDLKKKQAEQKLAGYTLIERWAVEKFPEPPETQQIQFPHRLGHPRRAPFRDPTPNPSLKFHGPHTGFYSAAHLIGNSLFLTWSWSLPIQGQSSVTGPPLEPWIIYVKLCHFVDLLPG